MLFSLEALEAQKGDSLILHYGDKGSPRFWVIDGGPAKVYAKSLKPRLTQIVEKFDKSVDDPLELAMVMVSHIDDDHIRGIIDWLGELESEQEDGVPFNIGTLWFNSFDDIAGNGATEIQSAVASLKASAFNKDAKQAQATSAIIASVAQGQNLRKAARRLAIRPNQGFTGMVMAPTSGKRTLKFDGLELTILSPSQKRLEELNKEWEKKIKPAGDGAVTAAFVDRSVANLSSIVVLVKATSGGKSRTMLLTGDARGDDLMDAAQEAGLVKTGPLSVDLLKVPHHGSNRNTALEFFEMFPAKHYVISANGEHDNPDPEVIEWIAEARGKAAYTLYFTNEKMVEPRKKVDITKVVKDALEATEAASPKRKVVFRQDGDLSVMVNLMDKVNY